MALDGLARKGFHPRRIADIGGGTGVLAMAAASVWPVRAIAGDIDPLATETARENVAANGLPAQWPASLRRVPPCAAAGGAPYDLVFANILAGPLRRMAARWPRTRRQAGLRSCRASSRGRLRASLRSSAAGATA